MTDKEILINLTKEMGLAQTGDEITRHWHVSLPTDFQSGEAIFSTSLK